MKADLFRPPCRQQKLLTSSGGPFKEAKLSSCCDFPLPQEKHREITLVLVEYLS